MIEFKYTHESFTGDVETKISYKIFEEGNIDDLMQEFRCFLLAVGYHPELAENYIKAE